MEFNIVDKLLGMTLIGSEWVLWLLIGTSVLSVTVMIERAIFFFLWRSSFQKLTNEMTLKLNQNDVEGALAACSHDQSLAAQVARVGLNQMKQGEHTIKAVTGSMEGYLAGNRHKLDRGLVILGTLGNNAPFIGLFGTVIGIIKAFHDLAQHPEGGPSVVMAGISEALVATAVGLVVAIPAVIAFNMFNRFVKRQLANTEAMMKLVSHYYQPAAKK